MSDQAATLATIALLLALTTSAAGADPRPAPAEVREILLRAYPSTVTPGEGEAIIVRDKVKLPIGGGDGADKSPAAVLEAPDIADMFLARYPAGPLVAPPAPAADPGRARNAAFFNAMYGDCRKGEVAANLVDVVWLPRKSGGRLRMTRINGAAGRLAAVSAELDALPDRFTPYLLPSAGTYNCRPIAGAERASAHGWGIAIDIAVARADYWRWSGRGARPPQEDDAVAYRNRIPSEIVAIFEKHGFIWGGKWHHHDTMHFEYRPEILAAGDKRK